MKRYSTSDMITDCHVVAAGSRKPVGTVTPAPVASGDMPTASLQSTQLVPSTFRMTLVTRIFAMDSL